MSKCDTCKHCKREFIFGYKKYCAFGREFFGKPEASVCIFYDCKKGIRNVH